jgi:diguanylate cyclase (GGDEF)-like protein/PAS domain S-box-containing protein
VKDNELGASLWMSSALLVEILSTQDLEAFDQAICVQLRDLTGARTTAIMRRASDGSPDVRSVCPQRRQDRFSVQSLPGLYEVFNGLKDTLLLVPERLTPDAPWRSQLVEAGLSSLIVQPFVSRGETIALLCIADLPELEQLQSVVDLVAAVAPVMGMALDMLLTRKQLELEHAELEERVAERTSELHEANQQLEAIAGSVNAGIIAFDHRLQIAYLSPRFTELFGYDAGDLKDWRAWTSRAAVDQSSLELLQPAPAGQNSELECQGTNLDDAEVTLLSKQGQMLHALLSIHRASIGPVFTFSDYTKRKIHTESIEFASKHDELTGLPNRSLFSERLDWNMKQSRRSRRLLCVGFLDLDGFKVINDTYGHEAGDQLLKVVSRRLRTSLREIDTVARLGGDEFAVVFTDLRSRDQALPLIQRLLTSTRAPVMQMGHTLRVSCSIGLSFYAQDPTIDGDQLLRQADKAMYDAKIAGKNRFAIFDLQADESLRRRQKDLNDIEQALREEAFELYYQPKVGLRTGRVMGAEALLRWRQKSGELLTPDAFLPTLGDHDLAKRLSSWVLDRGIQDLSVLLDYNSDLSISLNVFPAEITEESFPDDLLARLRLYPRVNPAHLEFEMVETAVLNDVTQRKR